MPNPDEDEAVAGTSLVYLRMPSGLKMPKPLNTEGNLAANWKKFKRSWDNCAIVARKNRFEEELKTATFLSAIGEDAMEIYEGMYVSTPYQTSKTYYLSLPKR